MIDAAVSRWRRSTLANRTLLLNVLINVVVICALRIFGLDSLLYAGAFVMGWVGCMWFKFACDKDDAVGDDGLTAAQRRVSAERFRMGQGAGMTSVDVTAARAAAREKGLLATKLKTRNDDADRIRRSWLGEENDE